jgi:hypothetical protein
VKGIFLVGRPAITSSPRSGQTVGYLFTQDTIKSIIKKSVTTMFKGERILTNSGSRIEPLLRINENILTKT